MKLFDGFTDTDKHAMKIAIACAVSCYIGIVFGLMVPR